eukprot:5748100-Lingulodinium_polyedra.AAC.1
MVSFDGNSKTITKRAAASGAAILRARNDGQCANVLMLAYATPAGAPLNIAGAWAGRMALGILALPRRPQGAALA